jgi:hypothetical protein
VVVDLGRRGLWCAQEPARSLAQGSKPPLLIRDVARAQRMSRGRVSWIERGGGAEIGSVVGVRCPVDGARRGE